MPRRPLAEGLADSILDDILSGKYVFGSVLPSESELAEESGMSRLTVREAVKELRAKKVLNVVQGRGTTVNDPEMWSVLDPILLIARSSLGTDPLDLERKFLEARRVVEVLVARLAAERRTDQHLAYLESEIGRMEQAAAQQNVAEFVDADVAFHQYVMEAADNPFIAALFEPLLEIVYLTRERTSSFAPVREHAIAHHREVLEAIRSADPASAAEAMANHLTQTEEDLETFVKSSDRSLMTVRRRKYDADRHDPRRGGRPDRLTWGSIRPR